MYTPGQTRCGDCNADMNRRQFLQRTSVIAASVGVFSGPLHGAFAAPSKSSRAETAAAKLFETLNPAQRQEICFAFDHPNRTRISANWAVSKPCIYEDFYTPEQRGLIKETFREITSEEGFSRFNEQMEADDGGFDRYHVGLFGDPTTDKFEWVLSGLHSTMRASGNSTPGAAFGGPIVYGHAEEDPKDNIFYYQTQKANEVFKALDANQAAQALLTAAPAETAVLLQGTGGAFTGLSLASLSADQQGLVREVIQVLLAPYRQEDVEEAMKLLESGGGIGALNMSFYKQGDLNSDQEWDIWRLEGPSFVAHFRGAPHVHAYLNIGTSRQG
ncbi:DUF3500 domain-containing protein [Planctomicrobium sp. SH668]|uniref:DUF3500 domain-containing protein n=1 Tax=Planctomicrobium sp. SH668 TaxID=3448126 RepID=UPI003F5B19F5